MPAAEPAADTGSGTPTVDPTPPAPGAAASVPQYSLTGARGCVTAGTDIMQWVLSMTDAGPRALRFQSMTPSDGLPGCDATIANPRNRLQISGVTNYTAHSSGQTTFTFDPRMYTCGRVQVDVSMFDDTGKEFLVLGMIVNYGTICAPTPPPPPPPPIGSIVCTPPSQTGSGGVPVSFAATGGSAYTWEAPGGTPAAGSGSTFTTVYPTTTSGAVHTVTVRSGDASATCTVTIPPTVSTLVCLPPSQNVAPNQAAAVSAAGGSGTYSWSAPGGSTTAGAGSTFSTSYPTAGTRTITVTSGEQTASCTVTVVVGEVPLVCAPVTQTVAIGQLAPMTATGGTGTYSWSAPGGTVPSGTGAAFSTAYGTSGTRAVTVTSGTQSATCTVVVPDPPLVCAPPTQTVGIGVPASMTASGGNGTYAWSAPGGTTPTGAGAAFSTAYASGGTRTVTVTSGAQSASCQVIVPTPDPPLVCAPPTQTVGIGVAASMTATGGNGTYAWTAPGGTTAAGAGAAFSTSYTTGGTRTVTVTSGGQSATCQVIVPTPDPPLVCAPPTQTVGIGVPASMTATGGNGTYAWTAPGGTTAAGAGAAFSTAYATAGTRLVTVTSGGQSATCQVIVPDPPALCPPPVTPAFTVLWPVFANISGEATVNGPGVWTLSMNASLTAAGYDTDTPTEVKAVDTITLVCVSPTTSVTGSLTVNYSWDSHPYTHWWVTLVRDGVRVFKSAEVIKP